MAERVLRLSITLFVGVYIARFLGPIQFGKLSYALSIVAIFSAFSVLGLDGIVVRELTNKHSSRDAILGTSFFLRIISAFLTCILLYSILLITDNTHEEKVLILIISASLLFQSSNVIDLYFQAKVQSKFVVQGQVIQVLLSSLIKILLILFKAKLIYFAVIILADSIILAGSLLLIYSCKKYLSVRKWHFRKELAKKLLKDSWPLILSGLAISLYMRIDQVMIREMLDPGAVGHYAAAIRLSEAWYFIPLAITTSVYPAIIKSKFDGDALYYSRLQQLYNLMVWISLMIAIPISFFAKDIIVILFGQPYSEAGKVLAIHIWASVFVSLGLASGKWLLVENLQIYALYRVVLGLFVNIFLNLILIPSYHIVGAAVATLSAQIFAAYIFDSFTEKTRHTFKLKTKAIFFYTLFDNNER